MSTEQIADILLRVAPWSFAIKTVVFLVLASILIGQKSLSPVGKWLVALFIATTVMSASLTGLMVYLDGIGTGEDLDTPREWILAINDAVWSLVVSATGVGVMIAQRRVEQELEEDA
jgi:hypothetical protein